MIDKKISNVSVNVPPIPQPKIIINLDKDKKITNIKTANKSIEHFEQDDSEQSDEQQEDQPDMSQDEQQDEKPIFGVRPKFTSMTKTIPEEITNNEDKIYQDQESIDESSLGSLAEDSLKEKQEDLVGKTTNMTLGIRQGKQICRHDYGWYSGQKHKYAKNRNCNCHTWCSVPIEDPIMMGGNYTDYINSAKIIDTNKRIVDTSGEGIEEKYKKIKSYPTASNHAPKDSAAMKYPESWGCMGGHNGITP